MGACVRTVQRWEQIYKLPIRRLALKKGAMVFALRSEVDRWIRKRTRRTKSELKDKHLRAMFLIVHSPRSSLKTIVSSLT